MTFQISWAMAQGLKIKIHTSSLNHEVMVYQSPIAFLLHNKEILKIRLHEKNRKLVDLLIYFNDRYPILTPIYIHTSFKKYQ